MNWYAVELHTHTRHSDGQMTVKELLNKAREMRLEMIALTDHNTQSGLIEAGEGVIPGIEWTTYRGHMTVLGASRYVDWRDIDPEDLDDKLWDIRRAGGLNCVAHPFRIGSPICTGCHFDYRIRDSRLINLWEVWSGGAPPLSRDNALSFRAWQDLLDEGARPAAVYGRDWHAAEANEPMAVTLLGVDGEISVSKALAALRKGRTAVSMGPIPALTVERGGERFYPGDEIEPGPALARLVIDPGYRREVWQLYRLSVGYVQLMGRGGRVLAQQPYRPEGNRFCLDLEEGPVRAEVWGEMQGRPCLLAFTSALFVRHRTMITAHNGAEGEAPDSLAFLRRAIETGCEALEVDVRLVHGDLILSHDEVEEGVRDLVRLDACFQLLAETPRVLVNIDVKEPGLAARVVDLAKEYGVASRLIFTGDLGEEDLCAFPERPEAFWNLSPEDSAETLPAARRAGCQHVNLDMAEITQPLMEKAANLGLLVSAWTADDEADILRLLRLGVDNITTNRPTLAMSLRKALERAPQV